MQCCVGGIPLCGVGGGFTCALFVKGLVQLQNTSLCRGCGLPWTSASGQPCSTNSTKEHWACGKSYLECICLESNASNYISIFSKYWKFHIWMTLSFCTCQRSFQVCNEPFLIISVSVRFSGKAFIFCTLLYKYRFVTVYTKRDVWGKWHILKCTLGLLKEKKCYLCLSQVYL